MKPLLDTNHAKGQRSQNINELQKVGKKYKTAGYNDVRTVLKTEMPLPRNSKTVVTLIYELTDPKSFRVRPMLDLIGHQYFCHYIQSHHFSHPIFLCLHLMKFSFVEARLDALKKKVWTEKLHLYLLKPKQCFALSSIDFKVKNESIFGAVIF